MKLLIFACLLSLALGHEVYYTPGYSYYPAAAAAGVSYTRAAAALPLAYSRLVAPVAASHVYHSVQTPSSFQQQYRSEYKPQPLTYEYIY
ncbi:CG34247 [Drosophila busckii]|uniref:CG34247 n=1 Tax=Drosophila busckii TaxID=30019 RepID=A0A0M4EHA1_DROBS|nr:uncharacterized protein LOC108599715 [Drosophila busckii]ALC43940.1 CG34247 [Drosophila busckii]